MDNEKDSNLFEKLKADREVRGDSEICKADIQISKSLFFGMPLSGSSALPAGALDNAGVVFLDHAGGGGVPL